MPWLTQQLRICRRRICIAAIVRHQLAHPRPAHALVSPTGRNPAIDCGSGPYRTASGPIAAREAIVHHRTARPHANQAPRPLPSRPRRQSMASVDGDGRGEVISIIPWMLLYIGI